MVMMRMMARVMVVVVVIMMMIDGFCTVVLSNDEQRVLIPLKPEIFQ